MSDLRGTPIYLTLSGSRAYGTERPGSDVDIRGVVVLSLRERVGFQPAFEHAEGLLTPELWALIEAPRRDHLQELAGSKKAEFAVDELAKFLTLCSTANPNALEVLFTDERHWLLARPAWRRLHQERHRFLTRKVKDTFLGYALAQRHRIEGHRAWLRSPPLAKPERSAFGLPEHQSLIDRDQRHRLEQSLAAKLRSYGIDELEMPPDTRIALRERLLLLMADVLAASPRNVPDAQRLVAAQSLGLSEHLLAGLNAEKRYLTALRDWDSYQTWLAQRNPQRADLERRFGYDTKHAMHLIRLLRMGLEALQTGDLRVERPDALELCAIRDGAWTYEELRSMAQDLESQIASAATSTALPPSVNLDHFRDLLFELSAEVTGARHR